MKKFSAKLFIFLAFLIFAGLNAAALWVNVIAAIGAVVMIIFIHLDNLDFCKKLDRVAAGEKNVKF